MTNRYPISHIGRLRMGNDGEGIRTLVLFGGCPLRCKYCINSFTWDGTKESKLLSAKELYDQILIDRPYMLATNGGITFGGGEPLLHSQAIEEFATINKDGFSLFVETSLQVSHKNLAAIVDVVDRYYIDVKTMDERIYKAYTGGDLKTVLTNLEYLLEKVGPQKILVRIPVIPKFADKESQLRSKDLLKSLGVKGFDLFEYRMR